MINNLNFTENIRKHIYRKPFKNKTDLAKKKCIQKPAKNAFMALTSQVANESRN